MSDHVSIQDPELRSLLSEAVGRDLPEKVNPSLIASVLSKDTIVPATRSQKAIQQKIEQAHNEEVALILAREMQARLSCEKTPGLWLSPWSAKGKIDFLAEGYGVGDELKGISVDNLLQRDIMTHCCMQPEEFAQRFMRDAADDPELMRAMVRMNASLSSPTGDATGINAGNGTVIFFHVNRGR